MVCMSPNLIAGCALLAISGSVAVCAQAPPATAPSAPSWKTYSYSADGFSASFPFEPNPTKKNVSTERGLFELRSYIAEDASKALFVGVCDYGNATQGMDVDTILDGAKDGALKNSNSHLVGTLRKITLGTYPGLAFESESDQAHYSARIYLVGTTLYQVLVVASIQKPYADSQRFLDSFQLIARNKN
jgi:hypothetical protein